MVCSKCNRKNDEKARFCEQCGAPLQEKRLPVFVPRRGQNCPLSGMAVAGLVLALVGIFLLTLDIFLAPLICGLFGFVFSTIAFVKCHKDPLLRGKEMAIIGAGISAIVTVVELVSLILMLLLVSLT